MFESLRYDPDAKRSVEPFGGAFVWSDELPVFEVDDRTIGGTRFLQYLIWYRKSLMENNPFAPFAEYWSLFQSECPTWPGFRPERCDVELGSQLQLETEVAYKQIERAFAVCERKRERDKSADK